ncbi:MAG: YihY/virulence factor BrkB family protein [Chitinispirillaceae bacterium]|nr:YihY/virulence factor BrkB family protein [Chitinispirillaceae bacterium]
MWGGAFAYNAFFSLFPLIILFITVASFFIDRARATTGIIGYVERYVPMSGEMHRHIFDTITGVVTARKQAGATAFLFLFVMAVQCFTTLIKATNRAWGTTVRNWWRLPMKSVILFGALAGAVFLGSAVPVLAVMVKDWLFTGYDFSSRLFGLGSLFIPLITVFFSLSLVYKFAPRRSTRFTEVWVGALCATILLRVAEQLFVIYLKNVWAVNAVYGTFGGIMALLLWIFLSGCVFIFGACMCAAQAETLSQGMHTSG